MNTQNQIKRTLSVSTNIDYISKLLDSNEIIHRTDLAKTVCEEFNFYDVRGQVQLSGCLKALRELEASGCFILPKAQTTGGGKKKFPQRLTTPVHAPVDVPKNVNEIRALELVLVSENENMRIWNELMIEEHPQGAGPLVGRQLRYLIRSESGWLGGFGFAAPALQLADRDQWIGWNQEERKASLHYLIGMSRFLIRPSVVCHNLASKVLSMSIANLARDFEQRYGYRPLLIESFVDTEHYTGTCYRAANWQAIGQTKGRGRQDQFSQASLSKKSIYIYPLETEFRQKLGLPAGAGLGALGVTDGLDSGQWAEQEFGGAPLGDARLSKRLVNIAEAKAQAPSVAFSGTVGGEWGPTKAYYRMIDQPENSAITLPNILAPHRQQTIRRMMSQKTVLCIQDGSELNYTNLDKCTGLADMKANQTGAKTRGLNLHSTFTVATNGLPLGVVKAQCIAPKPKSPDDKRKSSQIPIEEKKTFTWIEHHRDLVNISQSMPQTQLVNVCDREADFFELFDEQRQSSGVELLIRAQHDRKLDDAPFKLFSAVRQTPEQGRVRITVPRQSARTKKSKQKAKTGRPGRTAELVLRHKEIQLPAPDHHSDKTAIKINLVHVVEENPPENTEAVEWFLLTTVKIGSAADIEKCLRWYTLRWRIEDWHRVLKSGCRIGDLAHKTAERLRRAIAINLVIAWRIMLMTLLGRETPELPAEILFSDIEIRTLRAYAKKKKLPLLYC